MPKLLRRCRGKSTTHKFVVILDSYTGSLEQYDFTDTLCLQCQAALDEEIEKRKQGRKILEDEKKDIHR